MLPGMLAGKAAEQMLGMRIKKLKFLLVKSTYLLTVADYSRVLSNNEEPPPPNSLRL